MCVMLVVAVAPCQCFTPGGVQITSPPFISRFGALHSWTQPLPAITISVCPAGCVCQALREPGSNVTWPPVPRVASVAENSGVTDTVPVNVSAGPRADGRDSFGEISMCCARTGAVEHARMNNTIVILVIRMTSLASLLLRATHDKTRSSALVLFVADLFHPIDGLAVECLLHSDMRHRGHG